MADDSVAFHKDWNGPSNDSHSTVTEQMGTRSQDAFGK